jgi:hypothetical protein
MRNMLAHAGPEQRVLTPLGRQPNVETHVLRLEVWQQTFAYPVWDAAQVSYVRPGVCMKKFSLSAGSVMRDCVWKKHVLKTTTPRHNSKNIWCNHPKTNLGIKTICK